MHPYRKSIGLPDRGVTTAAIGGVIGIQDLFPVTLWCDPHPVVMPDDRREVGHEQQTVIRVFPFSQPAKNAVDMIAEVDPFKTRSGIIELTQRRLFPVQAIEVPEQQLYAPV